MGLPKQLLSNVTQEEDKEEVEEGGRRVGPFHGRRLLYGHFVTREREEEISLSLLQTSLLPPHQTIIYCDCQWDGSRKRQTIVCVCACVCGGRALPACCIIDVCV